MPRQPSDYLPLKPVELLVLTLLADEPRHGYALRQAILEHTDGGVELEAGNLYRHLRGLEDETLIEPAPAKAGDDERRVYYRPTRLGRLVLAAELDRLRALLQFAEQRRIAPRSRS